MMESPVRRTGGLGEIVSAIGIGRQSGDRCVTPARPAVPFLDQSPSSTCLFSTECIFHSMFPWPLDSAITSSWLINHEDHLKTFLEVDENLISFERYSPTVHSAVSPCPFLLKLWSETDFY